MVQNNQTHSEAELNIPASIPGIQQGFTLLPLSHLMAQDFPPVEWLVDGLIPEDAVVLLSGAPASFKTWLALEMVKSITTGEKFLGKFSTKSVNALIVDAESGERQLCDHFAKLNVNSESNIYYHCCNGSYLNEDLVVKLEAECWSRGIKLIIFDSLVRFHNGDENSAKEMSKVFEGFTYLKKCGITSLIICHTRKSSNSQKSHDIRNEMDSIRGSGDILAACDIHLAMSRPRQGNQVIVRQTKNRLDSEAKPFTAHFVKESSSSSKWHFGKILEDKQGIRERHLDLVLDYIQTFPGKNQKQILDYLQTCEGNQIYSDKPLRDILDQLETCSLIYRKHGKGRELLHYATVNAELTPNNDEEPQSV